MLDCKQLQVGDPCVATVPRRPMPPLASVGVRQNQEDLTPLQSPSDVTDVVNRNARKRRLLSVTQDSVNLPAWPSEEFAGSSQWNPWSSADLNPRVSPEEEEELERTRLSPLEPTDLRTSKKKVGEEEEEGEEIYSGRS